MLIELENKKVILKCFHGYGFAFKSASFDSNGK